MPTTKKTKLNTVQYRITGAFGTQSEGEVTEAVVLLDTGDGGSVLLYHPKNQSECGSIEMCHPVEFPDGFFYVSSCQETDALGWINVESQRHLTKLAKNLAKIRYSGRKR